MKFVCMRGILSEISQHLILSFPFAFRTLLFAFPSSPYNNHLLVPAPDFKSSFSFPRARSQFRVFRLFVFFCGTNFFS